MDFFLNLLNENQIALVGAIIASIIAISNVITMILPSVTENPWYNKVMKFLNALSLNILKNKNADDK